MGSLRETARNGWRWKNGEGGGSEKLLSQGGGFDGFLIQSLGKKEIEDAILHTPPPALCLSYHGCIPRLLCVAAYIHHEPGIIYLKLQDPEHTSLTV